MSELTASWSAAAQPQADAKPEALSASGTPRGLGRMGGVDSAVPTSGPTPDGATLIAVLSLLASSWRSCRQADYLNSPAISPLRDVLLQRTTDIISKCSSESRLVLRDSLRAHAWAVKLCLTQTATADRPTVVLDSDAGHATR